MERELPIGLRLPNFGGDARCHFSNGAQSTRGLHFLAALWFWFGEIHTHNRRCLGQPVTFEDMLLESLLEGFCEIERKLFRAGNDQSQRPEPLRFGLA